MSEAQSRKAVLSAVFKRRGANGRYTRLFDDLDADQKQLLLQRVQLGPDEEPIVGSFESSGRWLLLTTEKIAWGREGAVETLAMNKVVDAIADLHALGAGGRTKLEMRELQLKTSDGLHTIEVEPGAPLSGVWSVLKNVGARNRGAQRGHDEEPN